MRDQNNLKRKRIYSLLVVLFTSLFFISCTKQAESPVNDASASNGISNFHLSESKVVLLQGNADRVALSFHWDGAVNANTIYTVEAAAGGSLFAEPLDIISTNQNVVGFLVKDFNTLMCKLLYANNTGMVEFRIKMDAKGASQYSSPVALNVTTYLPYTEYDESKIFRVPGNYQNWIIATAPKIVSPAGNGEYEGYINFNIDYPQVLMLKGNDWDPKITYTNIGANKFGFGGSMMCIVGGAGVYLFKASTNTNTWSYTKINNWGVTGTAVPGRNPVDPVMGKSEDKSEDALSWSITTNLVKGSFRIRANNDNTISFGHKAGDDTGIPSYDGDNIEIKTPGSYTIKLNLQLSGNYAYSIQKNQ